MTTLKRDKYINKLSKLLGTDYFDLQCWIEEVLEELQFIIYWDGFEELQEVMSLENINGFSQLLIEHYEKEKTLKVEDIIEIVEQIKIGLE